jgi:SecA DEAD-like domain
MSKFQNNLIKVDEKTYDALLKEICDGNLSISKEKLDSDFQRVENLYKNILDVNENIIHSCAKKVKSKKLNSNCEKIACVWHAMEKFSGHKVRKVQILSVILIYHLRAGKLAQIGTGEGKTFIIAMIAALFALEGWKVDIGELIMFST